MLTIQHTIRPPQHSKTSFSISLQHKKACMAPMPSMYCLQTGQAYSEAMIHRGLQSWTCQLLYLLCLTPSSPRAPKRLLRSKKWYLRKQMSWHMAYIQFLPGSFSAESNAVMLCLLCAIYRQGRQVWTKHRFFHKGTLSLLLDSPPLDSPSPPDSFPATAGSCGSLLAESGIGTLPSTSTFPNQKVNREGWSFPLFTANVCRGMFETWLRLWSAIKNTYIENLRMTTIFSDLLKALEWSKSQAAPAMTKKGSKFNAR
jgi:hypothetical protein